MTTSISFQIQKTSKGYFYPTLNGKRFTSTNFARKYDARGLVKELLKKYGAEKLNQLAA